MKLIEKLPLPLFLEVIDHLTFRLHPSLLLSCGICVIQNNEALCTLPSIKQVSHHGFEAKIESLGLLTGLISPSLDYQSWTHGPQPR